MNELLLTVFSISISGSFVILLIYMLRMIFKNSVSQTWRYYIWLIVLVRLLLPFSPENNVVGSLFSSFDKAAISTQMEVIENYTDKVELNPVPDLSQNQVQNPVQNQAPNIEIQESYPVLEETGSPSLSIWSAVKDNIWLFWLCVSLVLIVQKVTKYYSFMKFIKAGRFSITDSAVRDIYKQTCESMNITKPPKIYVNKIIVSPLLAGIFKPFIVLPGINLKDQQLRYVFRHELMHYKNRDALYKWLAQIAVCIHWFNPLVYLAVREINKCCELSCDERVIKNLNRQEKQFYGDTLIAVIKDSGSYYEDVAAATMNENLKYLKERLSIIMRQSPRTKFSVILSVSLAFMILIGAVFFGAYAKNHASDKLLENTTENQTAEILTEQKVLENKNLDMPEVSEAPEVSTESETDGSVYDMAFNSTDFNNSYIISNLSGYEKNYIIFIEYTNVPFDSNDSVMSIGNGNGERRVYFNDETQAFSSEKTVLDAVNVIIQSWIEQNEWGTKSDFSQWHYLVTDIGGPYKESVDELAEKFYHEDNISYFSAVSKKINKETYKKLQDLAYKEAKISFFSVLSDDTSGVNYDVLGVKAYNDDKISFFSTLCDYMSNDVKMQLLNKAYEDGKINFFSVLEDEVSGVDYETLGIRAYYDNRINFFSILSDYMSDEVKAELFNKAYEDDKINFFSILEDEVSGVDYDALGVKAYNDDRISYFSRLSDYMSDEVKAEILNKAYDDNKINFFNVLLD